MKVDTTKLDSGENVNHLWWEGVVRCTVSYYDKPALIEAPGEAYAFLSFGTGGKKVSRLSMALNIQIKRHKTGISKWPHRLSENLESAGFLSP